MSDELVDFLLARIEEREDAARDGAGWDPSGRERSPGQWQRDGVNSVIDDHGRLVVYGDGPAPSGAEANHIALNDPAYVLAECEAKRRIVEEAMEPMPTGANLTDYMRGIWAARHAVLYDLASIWADHPDCREEWKP